jgi:hypothetical protein
VNLDAEPHLPVERWRKVRVNVARAREDTMRIGRLGLLVATVFAMAGASRALADMPPPDGYVETCTIARQQTSKTECLECMDMHDQTERCTNLLAPYCYVKVCKTWGSTSFTEVLCRTKDASAPVVPTDIMSLVDSRSYPLPNLPDGGVTPVAPSMCLPYTPAAAADASAGCSVPSGSPSERPLWPVLPSLGVLAVFILRRYRRAR